MKTILNLFLSGLVFIAVVFGSRLLGAYTELTPFLATIGAISFLINASK